MVQAAETFLDPLLHRHLAEAIDMREARSRTSVVPASEDTVYVAAADASGMMVSMIQSNFLGFGSGCVVPGTGIHMHNRGSGFSLQPGHPNEVGPSKRPFHTIIPGFVTRDGMADMALGVVGGHIQAQGHVQLLVRIEDYGQNPQAASDAPRFHMRDDGVLMLEQGLDEAVVADLRSRGHEVLVDPPRRPFGGAQLIRSMSVGYCAASDHRREGQAVGF
jgi:gamma-glutamyltranspeptidase/glutathione hydrolase